jgi:sacsin
MSQELLALSQDESLSYSPYVSIAMPLHDDPEFKGHVFCLMPLPLEGISLTGFPVHVNGYFSLSQNRRCVKWPTADLVGNKTKKQLLLVLPNCHHCFLYTKMKFSIVG